MNMSTEQHQQIDQSIYNFIKQVLPVAAAEQALGNTALDVEQQRMASMRYAKQVLDTYFPLSQGSHQDVRSYVVYYNQLLAFFNDGTQSGLAQPKQFVALCGHKCEPSSIVLKNNGFHIEISIDPRGEYGSRDCANIEDVQVEAALMTIVNTDQPQGQHSWASLVKGGIGRGDKQFTAKDGSDYSL
ncbi:malate synthase [Shewanella sp. Scap07]|uniref:malate synthase n=1 Tax=Shewanella sp. Scap07 TaxID=2589987 RepID=UPI0015C16450|nr:malate synthase [Shewanella sp. Scap07]QLE84934.1 malate synthase [Shewanella sp. Scap07]